MVRLLLLLALVLRLVASQRFSDYNDDEDLISNPDYDEDYWYIHPRHPRYHHGRHHHQQPCRTSPCPQNQPTSPRVKEETLPPVTVPPTTTSAGPTTTTISPSSVLYKSFWDRTKELLHDLLNLLNQLENESSEFTTPSSVIQDPNKKRRHIPFEEKTTYLPTKATTQAVIKSQTIPAKTTVKPASTSAPATKSQTTAAATTRKVDDATKSQTTQAAPKTTQASVVTKGQTTAVPKTTQAAPVTKKQTTPAAPKTVKPATTPSVSVTKKQIAVPPKTTPVVTKKPIVFSTSQATTKQSVSVSAVTKVQTVAPSTRAVPIASVKSAVFTAKPPIKNLLLFADAVPKSTQIPIVVDTKPIILASTKKPSSPVSTVATQATTVKKVWSTAAPTAITTKKPAVIPKQNGTTQATTVTKKIFTTVRPAATESQTTTARATKITKPATTKKVEVVTKGQTTSAAPKMNQAATVKPALTSAPVTTSQTTLAATTRKVDVTKDQTVDVLKTTPVAPTTSQAPSKKPVVFPIIPDFIIRGRTTVAPKTTQPIAFPTHPIVTKTPTPIVLATTVKKVPTTQLPIVTTAQTTQAPLPNTTQVPVSKKTFPSPLGPRKNSINNRPITSILTGEESSKPVAFPNLLQQVQAQSGKISPSAKDPLIVNIFEFPKIQHEKKPVTSQPPSDLNLDKIIQRVEDRAPWLSSYLRSDQQPNKNIIVEGDDANHLITARRAYPKGPPLQW